MCQCGCGDFRGDLRFPAPDGDVYVIDVYHGCIDCGQPAGIMLHRFTPEEAARWDVANADALEVTQDGVGIPVMDPEIMGRLMAKEVSAEMKAAVDDILRDAIRGHFRDASWKTQDEWTKERRKASARAGDGKGTTR